MTKETWETLSTKTRLVLFVITVGSLFVVLVQDRERALARIEALERSTDKIEKSLSTIVSVQHSMIRIEAKMDDFMRRIDRLERPYDQR